MSSPHAFFKAGQSVLPPRTPDAGLDMIAYVDSKALPDATKVFRTQSPRHFEGGDWYEGDSCQREKPLVPQKVEVLFSLTTNGTNAQVRLVNQLLFKSLARSSFRILDITHMSEFGADAHPASAGGKKHDDCMHWCLPGITDTWNGLLVTQLEACKIQHSLVK